MANHLEDSGVGGGGGGHPHLPQFQPRPVPRVYPYIDLDFTAIEIQLLPPPNPHYYCCLCIYIYTRTRTYSSRILLPVAFAPTDRGSTSGPDAMYNQNQNQEPPINITAYSNVPNDSINIGPEFQRNINDNDDDDDRFFPSFEEYPSWDYLAALNGFNGAEELFDVMSDSFSDDRYGGSGLSDETISNSLKIRKFSHQEDPSSSSSSNYCNICVVCQDHICLNENNEECVIGTLHCGHEYHADCIKRWLKHKNFCPLCKATALSMPTDESSS